MYSDRFWKKNWDQGMEDLKPEEYETTYLELIKDTFVQFSNKTAFSYLGAKMTFGELDKYTNRFANMLIENGFEKGDMVGIQLPNTPQYVIAVIGTLKAGCITITFFTATFLLDCQCFFQIPAGNHKDSVDT